MRIINGIKIVGRKLNEFKGFKELKNIDKKYYSSDFYDVNLS